MNLTEVNQTANCLQFSCPERSGSAFYVFLCMCAAVTVLLTVCGNMLIIISVCHFKQLHTPTNMLILSLAVSDFMVGLFVMPFHLSRMIESCWISGPTACVFYIFISFFVTSISIYNVALIAVDRYFAISNPFLYIEKVSVSSMCGVILAMWILLLSYNSALLYSNGNTGPIICPQLCFVMIHEIWSLVDLVFVFVIPCSAIIIFYAMVFLIAKKHATAIREINVQSKGSNNVVDSMKSERKAAKVLSILVIVFLACLIPYFINTLITDPIQRKSFRNVVTLVYLNSTINPVIYALFYPWFRRCLKIILTFQIFRSDSALMNVH
ncbi:trace amine-associated receptor 13c-like [Brachyhypopomus gauderio]|uniref:trace amine-associated receptor 13c-like n=1 Tax=Brachyhypopomus gauderio TaxID=698409 RepID=UPI0040432293